MSKGKLKARPPDKVETFIFRSKTKGGRQRVRKIEAQSFELAKEIALLKYSDILYFKPKPMDLVTALERAKKASKTGRNYYIITEADGECSINTAPLRGATHKFVKGELDKAYKGKSEELDEVDKPKAKTLPAHSDKAQKLIGAKAKKESAEKDSDIKTNNKMEKVAVKKSAKKTSKPVKKAAAKKVKSGPSDWGKKVTMTNKEMSAKIKKGYIYRNSQGVNKTKYIPERPNQDLVNEDYFESKPE